MPLIPVLRKQRQADFCEFETSLLYKNSSRIAKAVTHRNPVSRNQKKNRTILYTNGILAFLQTKLYLSSTTSYYYSSLIMNMSIFYLYYPNANYYSPISYFFLLLCTVTNISSLSINNITLLHRMISS